MPEVDQYVERVITRVDDGDIARFRDDVYTLHPDRPTLPYPRESEPRKCRDQIRALNQAARGIFRVLLEQGNKVILGYDGPDLLDTNVFHDVTPTGVEIFAATSQMEKDPQQDRTDGRESQQDRIAIHCGVDAVQLNDGVGGHDDGDKAAQLLSEYHLIRPHRTRGAVTMASSEMLLQCPTSAACMITGRLLNRPNGTWDLIDHQSGDCKLSVIKPDYKIRYSTKDENMLQFWMDQYGIGLKDVSDFSVRHQITNLVGAGVNNPVHKHTTRNIEPGSIILMTCDGIHDSITHEEFVEKILKQCRGNVRQAITLLARELERRVTDENRAKWKNELDDGSREDNRVFSDGYVSKPPIDNISIATMKVPT